MKLSTRVLLTVITGLVLLTVLFVSFHLVFLELLVDYWWYSSLDYQGYFWLRTLYKYLIPGGVTLCFLFIFFSNFWIASRFIGINTPPSDNNQNNLLPSSKQLIKKFQTGSLVVYFPLSLIMSVIVALPFHYHWEKAILYFFAPATGIGDPMFNFDVSFYMFSLPIFQLIQKQLFGITLFLFIAVAFLYWLEHRVFAKQKSYPKGVKIHLGIMAILICVYVVLGFLLDRFNLVFNDSHEPIFFGPGFVEARYQIPMIWLSIFTFLLAASSLAFLYYSHGKKGRKRSTVLSIIFLLSLGLKNTYFIPDLINQFIVQPNPVSMEKPFMRYNTEATLSAYALDHIKTVDFEPTLTPLDDLLSWEGEKNLDNVPLWDRGLLKNVYFQLQGLRPYYNFLKVSEDRYLINDTLKQVNLSAREINTSRLPQSAQNWENIHLRYTHGYGAVMTPAAQIGGQPQQWFLRDLELFSPVDITIKKPEIFYGLENYSYALEPNDLEIAGITGSKTEVTTGKSSAKAGGILINSLFHKLLFSIYFNEERIFFSVNISGASRMMMHRNIMKRINKLAPYLKLDSEPYLVISNENLYWIQDAYTLSNQYPISRRSIARFRNSGKEEAVSFNYIRNSVKILVNAYNGKTDFYIADPDDPIVKAYDRAYPGFFKSLTELPPGLNQHLRYPRDIFYQQMHIYKSYHQVAPELFYQQAETWGFPELESKQLKPYYLTTALHDCDNKQQFVLLTLMTPVNLDNLSAFATAGTLDTEKCTQTYKPSITLYKVKKDIQLNGPVQISALIDQDPVISEQLTLWGQHGSTVVRGRMILLPVGNTVLYLQPIYLISTKTEIPELARVIVANGNEMVMQPSATEAFKQLVVKLGATPALIYPELEKKQAKPTTVPLSIPFQQKQKKYLSPLSSGKID